GSFLARGAAWGSASVLHAPTSGGTFFDPAPPLRRPTSEASTLVPRRAEHRAEDAARAGNPYPGRTPAAREDGPSAGGCPCFEVVNWRCNMVETTARSHSDEATVRVW